MSIENPFEALNKIAAEQGIKKSPVKIENLPPVETVLNGPEVAEEPLKETPVKKPMKMPAENPAEMSTEASVEVPVIQDLPDKKPEMSEFESADNVERNRKIEALYQKLEDDRTFLREENSLNILGKIINGNMEMTDTRVMYNPELAKIAEHLRGWMLILENYKESVKNDKNYEGMITMAEEQIALSKSKAVDAYQKGIQNLQEKLKGEFGVMPAYQIKETLNNSFDQIVEQINQLETEVAKK